MRQGNRASLLTALSGLLLLLAARYNIPHPTILALGLPMRAVPGGSSSLGDFALSVARIVLAGSWLTLLLFESRRYLISWILSQHLGSSHREISPDATKALPTRDS